MISKLEATAKSSLPFYRDKGIHFLEDLNGIFAFALYDEEKMIFLSPATPSESYLYI